MNKRCQKKARENGTKRGRTASYKLSCAQTKNGLSHFVMYGDVPKEKTLL